MAYEIACQKRKLANAGSWSFGNKVPKKAVKINEIYLLLQHLKVISNTKYGVKHLGQPGQLSCHRKNEKSLPEPV